MELNWFKNNLKKQNKTKQKNKQAYIYMCMKIVEDEININMIMN